AYDSEDDCTVKSDPLNVAVPELIDFVIEDVTCYGAEKASAKITVTAGTEDREFQVWYREFEGQVGEPSDWTLFNGWFTESIVIADTLVFDDVNILDVHYEFYIEDDNGCKSQIDTMTFDMVDGPLQVIGITEDVSDCQTEVSFVIAGGTAPYMVMIDSVVVVDSIGFNQQITLDLGGGQHEVFVLDANTCTLSDVIEVTYGTVRDTTIETLAGTEAHFVDAEAGVDTMLAVGEYSFGYAMDTICGAVLNVTVLERGLLISDIQGMADTSAMVGDTVMISGTITGIWAGNGFFMQDESAAWSGIAVQYPDTDTLEIGEGATVVGVVTEWEGITTIVAGMVTVGTADVEITPVVVASPSLVKDEMYESVLVMVEGAGTTNGLEDGMWAIHYEVTDFAVVDTVLYKPADTVVVAGHNYDVTGIVNGYASLYLLEPRMAEDIVDLTIDDVEKIGSTIEFKVYPNPFNDKIRIDNYDKLTRVVVSNIAGQRVIDIEYPNYEIRTANLVSGVYVVSLFTEDGLAKSERIIKR
ncbi:MAG: T9SS type A sorting domain-containing protein, partial [Bacteroidota bacterium]